MRTSAAGREPAVAVDGQPGLQVEPPGAARFVGRGNHAAVLDQLKRADWEDSLRAGRDVHGAGPGQPDAIADLVALDAEVDHRAAAQEGAARAYRARPGVIAEGFVAEPGVGAVQAHRNVGAHLVGAAYQRQAVAAVEVAVILLVEGTPLDDHLDPVGSPGGDHHRWFAVRPRKGPDDHASLLLVTAVGPVPYSRLKPSSKPGSV